MKIFTASWYVILVRFSPRSKTYPPTDTSLHLVPSEFSLKSTLFKCIINIPFVVTPSISWRLVFHLIDFSLKIDEKDFSNDRQKKRKLFVLLQGKYFSNHQNLPHRSVLCTADVVISQFDTHNVISSIVEHSFRRMFSLPELYPLQYNRFDPPMNGQSENNSFFFEQKTKRKLLETYPNVHPVCIEQRSFDFLIVYMQLNVHWIWLISKVVCSFIYIENHFAYFTRTINRHSSDKY